MSNVYTRAWVSKSENVGIARGEGRFFVHKHTHHGRLRLRALKVTYFFSAAVLHLSGFPSRNNVIMSSLLFFQAVTGYLYRPVLLSCGNLY